MINKGQCYVRALNSMGKWDSVDVLDLDEDSFRRFVISKMAEVGLLVIIKSDVESPPLQKKKVEITQKEAQTSLEGQ